MNLKVRLLLISSSNLLNISNENIGLLTTKLTLLIFKIKIESTIMEIVYTILT